MNAEPIQIDIFLESSFLMAIHQLVMCQCIFHSHSFYQTEIRLYKFTPSSIFNILA